MDLLNGLKKNNTVYNTKGSKYYNTSYNANLDVFAMLSRFNDTDDIINKFRLAILEDENFEFNHLIFNELN